MDALSLSTKNTQDVVADALAAKTANVASNAGKDKTKEAAKQFEGFFVGQMMEYMSAGLKADGVFGGGQAEETWRSLLNQEYGKEIAKSGKLNIADSVMKSMLQMQEKRTQAQSATQGIDAGANESVNEADPAMNAAAAALAGSTARSRSIVA